MTQEVSQVAPAASEAGRSFAGRRVAIVHDWFQGYHGSERVVEAMLTDVFRDADRVDVMTFSAVRELLPEPLAAAIVRESRFARLPGIRQRGHHRGRWRYFLPYMPRYFRGLPLDGYDLVVASSHACAVNVRPPGSATFVCYCHTPMRYAWMPTTDRSHEGAYADAGVRLLSRWLRRTDLAASHGPDGYVANSLAVKERIRRFYDRDATVIPPPVDLDDFRPVDSKRPGHFLWVHRLIPYKEPEAVIEAFRGLPQTLTMVGVGPLEGTLRASLPSNVELRGWISREELAELYASASGFIHVGEEDFGISMVEALASGTPVIALGRGGALDIIRDGVDGVMVDEPSPESIREAVAAVSARTWDSGVLSQRAAAFSRAAFVDRFTAYVTELEARL